jgi:hypothetical protein
MEKRRWKAFGKERKKKRRNDLQYGPNGNPSLAFDPVYTLKWAVPNKVLSEQSDG